LKEKNGSSEDNITTESKSKMVKIKLEQEDNKKTIKTLQKYNKNR